LAPMGHTVETVSEPMCNQVNTTEPTSLWASMRVSLNNKHGCCIDKQNKNTHHRVWCCLTRSLETWRRFMYDGNTHIILSHHWTNIREQTHQLCIMCNSINLTRQMWRWRANHDDHPQARWDWDANASTTNTHFQPQEGHVIRTTTCRMDHTRL
jgi:hypothetical protein